MTESLFVSDDGEIPFRRPQIGVPPVGDFDLVTKAWAIANLGGGGGTWGTITGTLSSQTDLQAALDAKATLAGPNFTAPAGSLSAAPTLPGHYIRGTELTASQSAQDAANLAFFVWMNAGAFTTQAPVSAVAATTGNQLVRYVEHAADLATKAALSHVHSAADVTTGTLAVARGGTGAATAQAAIDALSNVSAATNEHVLTKDTGTGNAIFKAASGGVSDGDKGDVVVSSSGTVWSLDSAVVTAAARTVLDDSTVAAMVDTLGGAASTGSTGLVRANSPALTTPNIGAATAASVNKVEITPPEGDGATLTIANGMTLSAPANATVSNTNTGDQTITLTGDVTGSGTGSFAATLASPVATARLGSGTADLQRFLAGDQTWRPPPLRVQFHAYTGAPVTATNQPLAERFLLGVNGNITGADLTGFAQVRLRARVTTASASGSSPRIVLKYSNTFSTTLGNYENVGTSEVAVSLALTGIASSGWIDIAASAKTDTFLALTDLGGNASADPAFHQVWAEFR